MASSLPSTPLIEFNFASNLPIKLCANNYPTWFKQIMHLLKANNLEGYVTGSTPCPPSKIGTGDAAITNPAYLHWCRQDNHVSLALLGSCTIGIIGRFLLLKSKIGVVNPSTILRGRVGVITESGS